MPWVAHDVEVRHDLASLAGVAHRYTLRPKGRAARVVAADARGDVAAALFQDDRGSYLVVFNVATFSVGCVANEGCTGGMELSLPLEGGAVAPSVWVDGAGPEEQLGLAAVQRQFGGPWEAAGGAERGSVGPWEWDAEGALRLVQGDRVRGGFAATLWRCRVVLGALAINAVMVHRFATMFLY